MTTIRDDFPATSIGRTAGHRLQTASSGLETHPLLSPRPASPAPSDHGSITGASLNNNSVHPRYIPYTPRQRVTPTATTTGTTVHPSSPQHQSGDATSKLQLMHLKAAAQMIGLDSGTLGWAMLERLVLDAEVGDEWTEVWNAITSGKATLLLPLEALSTNERITPDFMRDHIALCDGPSRSNAPLVTLSGLRGTLEDETLIFRSTINTSSKLFQDLLTPSTRTSCLSRLPPLPSPFPNIPPISYPQYQLTSNTSSLHFPPRLQTSSKPPLPPRPGVRPQSTSRIISNPFASLFGGPKSTPQPPPSPPTSLRSVDLQNDSSPPVEVSAFAIDRRIIRREIAKETNKALRSELKAAIKSRTKTGSGSIPHWVAERIHDLTAHWYPFVHARGNGASLIKNDSIETSTKDTTLQNYVVNSIDENLEDISEHFQDFFVSLEQDLRASKKVEKASESEVEDTTDREEREKEMMEVDAKIRETMEAAENLITWLFYDRLFSQPTTDDASHDEALSNRIAALNLLDLGLGHLGIDIGEVNEPDLDAVVNACGEMLSQLDSCRCPADKASVLVAAHKIVVDGLARLPPVRLISEDEAKSQEMDSEVPLTAKPKPALNNNTVLDLESPVVNSSPRPQAVTAPVPSETNTGDNTSPSEGKDLLSVVEPKNKPAPPPLDLDNPKPQVSLLLKEPTPVSGDVLFPLIIFSVVKANPAHLVSNLLFTQRFRNQSIGGEESYCLINMMAVAEFLENVDMAALGLDNTDKVLSTADLTPILSSRSPITAETPLAPSDGAVAALRGRVEQQVDAITGSANKVISGVVDSSFGILRSFIPVSQSLARSASSGRMTPGTPGRASSLGLLRRESGFSIASLAASLPIAGRSRAGTAASSEEAGQQMMSVSRLSPKITAKGYEEESDEDDDEDEEDGESVSSKEESEEEEAEGRGDESERVLSGDIRSVRSFESMLSASRGRKGAAGNQQQQQPRKTLSDRLASMSALATSNLKGSSPRSSLHMSHQRSKSTTSAEPSRPESPVGHAPEPSIPSLTAPSISLKLTPPKQRFMECTPDDLRLSEVGELLREYRRLVDEVRAAGGFEE